MPGACPAPSSGPGLEAVEELPVALQRGAGAGDHPLGLLLGFRGVGQQLDDQLPGRCGVLDIELLVEAEVLGRRSLLDVGVEISGWEASIA